MSSERTSEYYRTKNLPERFDKPGMYYSIRLLSLDVHELTGFFCI